MTQTTTTAQPLTIPAAGLEHRSGDLVATVAPHPQAGYRLQVRIAGVFNAELSSGHVHQHDALRAWDALVAQYPATAEPAPVIAIPGNVGTHMRVSDPGHVVLAIAATAADGIVEQGGHLGQATRPQLRSLTAKGYLTLIYQTGRRDARQVIVAGRITDKGRARLAELTAADRETARIAAAIARPTTAAQLISA